MEGYYIPGPCGGIRPELFNLFWSQGARLGFRDWFSHSPASNWLDLARRICTSEDNWGGISVAWRSYCAIMLAKDILPAPTDFNCVARALGKRTWVEPTTADALNDQMKRAGFRICKEEEAMVGAFGWENNVEHVALFRHGRWESKLGSGPVLVHRDFADMEPFGPPVRFWRKPSGKWTHKQEQVFVQDESDRSLLLRWKA